MQKKLIALAIAGLASTAAFAQSNVTIYGIADVGLVATSNLGASNGQTQYAVNSGLLSTSRIGFKGVEDLGNGLKALFTLEYGLNMDANAGIGGTVVLDTSNNVTSTNARQQFVGLTGGFGTVVAGRLQTTGLDFTVAGSALGGSTGLGATNLVGGTHGLSLISALTGRANNAVAYISPSFGGLTLAYNHARVSETALTTNNTDNQANLVSASYASGPITAGAIYSRITMDGPNNNLGEWGVRGGYDFSVVKLQAAYQQGKLQNESANKKWVVSATVPVGAKVALITEFAHLSKKSTAFEDNVNVLTLASTYALSKRTTAYAGFVAKRTQNGIGSTFTADTNTYGLGLRHSF